MQSQQQYDTRKNSMKSAPNKNCECFDCFNTADRDSGKNERVSFHNGDKVVEADGELRPYLHGVDSEPTSKPRGPSRSSTGMSTKSNRSPDSDHHSSNVSTSYDSQGNKVQELKGDAAVRTHYNWDTNTNTDYSGSGSGKVSRTNTSDFSEAGPGRVSRTNTSGSSRHH